jgi:hypothetical protein
MLSALPEGITPVAVRGEPQETRRIVLARPSGPIDRATVHVADALIAASLADGILRRTE